MKRAVLALLVVGCGAAPVRPTTGEAPGACVPGDHAVLGDEVEIVCLAEDVWVFTALAPHLSAITGFPASGLLVEHGEASTMVDTGWIPEHAALVLDFAERVRHRPVTAAVVTHFHDDRIGGAAALTERGIPVYALSETAERAAAIGTPFTHVPLEPASLPDLTWMFPGAGHSPENVVVFHPATQTLFGGCFIKSLEAVDLGNLSDADVHAWEPAIELVIASYPDVVHVVPGHGAPGDRALLLHTLELVDPPECTSDADCRVVIEDLAFCTCCGCDESPRAMSSAAYESEIAMRPSCDPICEGRVCPDCPTPEERAHLFAVCHDGDCALERRP